MQIKRDFMRRIQNEELPPGYRLPSERALAAELGVHRNTVVKAYQQLIFEEYVESRRRRPMGYFVRNARDPFGAAEADRNGGNADAGRQPGYVPFPSLAHEDVISANRAFDKLFLRYADPKYISFAGEIAARETYPTRELSAILARLARTNPSDLYEYCPPKGMARLRRSVAAVLKDRRIKATPSQIQIMTETSQTLVYIIRLYLEAGDRVLVESPLQTETWNFFKMSGIRPISVPVDKGGMVTDNLDLLYGKYRPKLVYAVPNFHTPTGADMSMERRRALLDFSYKHNIPIIEEDCVSQFRFDGPDLPSLKAMDSRGMVIYSSSFLYTMFPGLRIGFLVAPREVTDKVSALISSEEICISSLSQLAASEFIDDGSYARHCARLADYYREKRDLMADALTEIKDFKLDYDVPRGGMSFWVKLPDSLKPSVLLSEAEKRGVGFIPGSLFYPEGEEGGSHIRLSYAQTPKESITRGIRLLHRAMRSAAKR
jgi:DNA-binding transcriptional MocR family regulator